MQNVFMDKLIEELSPCGMDVVSDVFSKYCTARRARETEMYLRGKNEGEGERGRGGGRGGGRG